LRQKKVLDLEEVKTVNFEIKKEDLSAKKKNAEFLKFIEETKNIPIENLRIFFTLRRSEQEKKFPGFESFITLLEDRKIQEAKEYLEKVGDTEYRGKISLRRPGVVGTYRTVVRLVESDPPLYGRLEGELDGTLGTLTGSATFRLAESGTGTRIDYDGQAVIGGPLARLDARFAEGLAGSLIRQGLHNLDARLTADPSAGGSSDHGNTTREMPA